MHTYRQVGNLWRVGFRREGPVVRFEDIKDFDTELEAAKYASWLNGGAQAFDYAQAYVNGRVETVDANRHLLLAADGGKITLKGCQIANRSTAKDALVTLYDGDDPAKQLAFLGCPSLDARSYIFDPPLVATTDIYCASADALATIYVTAQGYRQ